MITFEKKSIKKLKCLPNKNLINGIYYSNFKGKTTVKRKQLA
jgi:hypothetical protein